MEASEAREPPRGAALETKVPPLMTTSPLDMTMMAPPKSLALLRSKVVAPVRVILPADAKAPPERPAEFWVKDRPAAVAVAVLAR